MQKETIVVQVSEYELLKRIEQQARKVVNKGFYSFEWANMHDLAAIIEQLDRLRRLQ